MARIPAPWGRTVQIINYPLATNGFVSKRWSTFVPHPSFLSSSLALVAGIVGLGGMDPTQGEPSREQQPYCTWSLSPGLLTGSRLDDRPHRHCHSVRGDTPLAGRRYYQPLGGRDEPLNHPLRGLKVTGWLSIYPFTFPPRRVSGWGWGPDSPPLMWYQFRYSKGHVTLLHSLDACRHVSACPDTLRRDHPRCARAHQRVSPGLRVRP